PLKVPGCPASTPPTPPPYTGEGGTSANSGIGGAGVRRPRRPARAPSLRFAPAPSPACGGRLGWGGRAAGAEGARAARLPPPQPSPAHGGGRGGRNRPLPRFRVKVGAGGAALTRLLLAGREVGWGKDGGESTRLNVSAGM